ncbi:hypothetical protein V5O48_011083 [Marasmius crinis-equi]|uniref:F-box domain-containing protein n=1 Tax=Marasmius crinis-equi TaxID=585013 RepID=A0ABR3F6J6_9AGAR
MHRVLGIAEVLRAVFLLCDKPANSRNAQVCRAWNGVALDILWEEIEDLLPVFKILGDVSSSNDRQYFSRKPTSGAWRRFQSVYAPRVHTLNCENLDIKQQDRMSSMMDVLARLQHSGPIFPNLTTFIWGEIDSPGYVHYSIIFMHIKVTDFRLRARSQAVKGEEKGWSEYFEALSQRMPALENLEVEMNRANHAVCRRPLGALSKALSALTGLSLPAMNDASDTLEELSHCPQLESIEFTRETKDEGIQTISLLALTNLDTFQHLQQLRIHISYPALTHFLRSSPSCAPSLHTLVVFTASHHTETPSTIGELLDIVARCFEKSLKLLCLQMDDRYPPNQLPQPPQYNDQDILRFHHIEQVLRCSHMADFVLDYGLPLALTAHDFEKIASSWPSLKLLSLCQDVRRDFPENSSFGYPGLDALAPLAKGCPQLELIALRLAPVVNAEIDDLSIPLLPNLHTLTLGDVVEQFDPVRVTIFLSQVLPSGCTLNAESCSKSPAIARSQESVAEWNVGWRDVKMGLQLIEALKKRTVG